MTVPHRALVLTAGAGTRLRPLSYVRAKPAVPVAGVPLIRRVLSWLVRQHVEEVALNLHALPATITGVVGDGRDLGVRVRYLWEPRILGSAGGPRAALPLLGSGIFFIVNGDTLTDLDLSALAAAHHRSGAQVTLAVIDNPDPDRYGGVVTDDEGWVRQFISPGDPTPSVHFVGVQLVDASVFHPLPAGLPAATIGGLYSTLVASDPHAILAYRVSARFLDVGTPADYLASSLMVAADEGLDSLPHGARVRIDSTARLCRTAVWNDVHIERDCELVDCVIADGAHLDAGLRFRDVAIVPARDPIGPNERRIGRLLVAPLAGADSARVAREPR